MSKLINWLALKLGLDKAEASDEDYAPIPRLCGNCVAWIEGLSNSQGGFCRKPEYSGKERTGRLFTCEWHEYDPRFLREREEE